MTELDKYAEILFAECKKEKPLCCFHRKFQKTLDEHELVAAPIDATTKMLNAGIEAGAENIQQAETIYASMLLAFQE
ncbi:MAG: hypothetical protein KAJ75_05600 [Alphaproteobacteria bacterium]|nr:hypothetical protein [Alphaproteobacteria bacterium]